MDTVSKFWWVFLVRGIFALFLGLMALFIPGITFTGLVLFLGAYMFVDGIFSVIAAIAGRRQMNNWTWLLISGIARILIGAVTFYNPLITATALVYMVAFWALIAGLIEIAIAIRLRKEITGEGWYIAGGIITFIFGVLILFNPVAGALTLTMIFGIYALVIGIMLIYIAIRLRKRGRQRIIPVS